jgi:hypothetical protein
MRYVNALSLRTLAAALTVLGTATLLAGAPSCAIANLINAGEDCSSACTNLKKCGLLHVSDCSIYCASTESTASFGGCTSQLAAQSSCGAANSECTAASAEMCATETMALATCIKNYCTANPNGEGCSNGGDAGTDGG